MALIKNIFILLFLLSCPATVFAQYITVDETMTAQQLVQNVLIDNPCLIASNISVSGLNQGGGGSYGHFSGGTSSFPFTDGIILSTGKAASAVGPNSSILSEGPTSWGGDSDLEHALGVGSSINATVLEFDFLPLASKISFDYIFSSEQYLSNPSPNQCNYTDGFVFLLKKANTSDEYQNLAIIPGTNTPVKVNTVRGSGTTCPAANEAYFGGFNGFAHPTNFNGQTVIMTAQTTVTPGVLYHIKLVVADQGNNLYDSAIFLGGGSFKAEKDLGEDRLIAERNPICDGGSWLLDATEPGTNTYKWFKNNVLQPETTPTYNVTTPGIYSVEITFGAASCISTGKITIEYADPLVLTQGTLLQCDPDQDGITSFNLRKADDLFPGSTVYYEHQADVNPIPNPESYISAPKTIYAKVTNAYGCGDFVGLTLDIPNNPAPAPVQAETCDLDETPDSVDDSQDGLYHFDLNAEVTPMVINNLPAGLAVAYYLSTADAVSGAAPLANVFENTVPFTQVIWARITNGPDCYGIIPVTLVVHTFKAADFEDEEYFLCDGTTISLSVAAGYQHYQWDNADASTSNTITVGTANTYHVTVTNADGCTDTKTFIVKQSGAASITSVDIKDFQGSKNSVTVIVSGNGTYEFSLDGNTYQDDALFTDVASGEYTVYVKDKNKCGITKQDIFVLDYPKFFTPNNDGYNDTWRIPFLQYYPTAGINIFDRFGKLVYSFHGAEKGWDGKLDSRPLPATDYWFVITLENNRIIKGHFALKR